MFIYLLGKGENGVQIGYGESWYHQNNMSVTVQLVETGWYMLNGNQPVTRQVLLSALTNVKYLMLRAKFHTDQVEGRSVSVCNSVFSILLVYHQEFE